MRIHFVMMLALLAGVSGCDGDRPKLVPVTGKVLHKNEPLTAGNIYFHPDPSNIYVKDKPSSVLQIDGGFTIKTFPFGDGVPPGKYKVTLGPDLAKRIGQSRYADPDRTPWEVTVPDAGIKDHVFEVK